MFRRFVAAGAVVLALAGIAPPAHAAEPLDLKPYPDVLLMGDSYTEGVGDDNLIDGKGYVPALAKNMNWKITRDGKGGSGYINPACFTTCAGVFADRFWRHPADAYDLVIIQGSSNDKRYDSLALASAYNMTIRTVRSRYPSAKIVMVGPTNPGAWTGEYVTINAKIKQYAGKYAIPYISPMDERWFVAGDGKTYANPVDGHPNNRGYARIADRLTRDLKALS